LYPLLASSYAAISDLHAAGLIYTLSMQQTWTTKMDLLHKIKIYCFSTATRHGHDMQQVNAKKGPIQAAAECSSLCWRLSCAISVIK